MYMCGSIHAGRVWAHDGLEDLYLPCNLHWEHCMHDYTASELHLFIIMNSQGMAGTSYSCCRVAVTNTQSPS